MKLTVFIAGLCISVAAAVSGEVLPDRPDRDELRHRRRRGRPLRGWTSDRDPRSGQQGNAYTLSPKIVVPAEVKVGRRVTLYTEPGKGERQLVSRVTTTSVTSEGNVKRTTEDTRTLPSGATTLTTTTSVSGKVEAYEAGKTLTITRSDGSKVTYVINEKSKVPADLVIGKTVSVLPLATSGSASRSRKPSPTSPRPRPRRSPRTEGRPGTQGAPGVIAPGASSTLPRGARP